MKKVLALLTLFIATISPFQFANANTGEVARAQFTTAIEAREPVDKVTILSNDVNKVYFFSELRNLQGQSVTHRWLLGGKVMAEVNFNVGGPRWRVNSSKTLLQETILRLENLDNILNPIIVCNNDHRFIVADQLHQIGILNPTILGFIVD